MSAIPKSTLPGHKTLHERVVTALEVLQESKAVDFKESSDWATLCPKLLKTSMAMANLRGGGVVIIGVSARNNVWSPEGIQPGHLGTYDEDTINDQLNRFASPSLRVALVMVDHEGATFLAVSVPEFHYSPIVCKRTGHSALREATIYVRRDGKPQSTQIAQAEDLEHLLELAAEKRARRFLESATRVGMRLPADAEVKFDRELEGL